MTERFSRRQLFARTAGLAAAPLLAACERDKAQRVLVDELIDASPRYEGTTVTVEGYIGQQKAPIQERVLLELVFPMQRVVQESELTPQPNSHRSFRIRETSPLYEPDDPALQQRLTQPLSADPSKKVRVKGIVKSERDKGATTQYYLDVDVKEELTP